MFNNFDKNLLISNFNSAAKHYEQYALIQKEIGGRLFDRLKYIKLDPKNILDLGCGPGPYTRQLATLYSQANVTGIDISPEMIAEAIEQSDGNSRLSFYCEEATRTHLADHSFDLIFSNLLFHWCDTQSLVKECFRLLKPNGLLLFTSLGPDTLYELRQSWKKIDNFAHVNSFTDMHHVGDALLKQDFKDPVTDVEYLTATFPDLLSLMSSLKSVGVQNANVNRPLGLYSTHTLKKLAEYYEEFRNENNLLPITFEVIYGQAWQPDLSHQQTRDAEGNVRIPIKSLKRSE